MDRVRVSGTDMETIVGQLVNESVLEFVREYSWKRVIKTYSITTDGSDSYSLPNDYVNEVELVSTSQKYHKFNYRTYYFDQSKDYKYAVDASNIYIDGTGATLLFFYTSPGSPFPLSSDSDESEPIKYYWDVILQMAVWKYYEYVQDIEGAQWQLGILERKINDLKRQENRARNAGKRSVIASHNRGSYEV